jgi:16S rRNA (guanine527-N7)-methyltransferase
VNEEQFAQLQAVAGPVSRETFFVLERFQAEFIRWNKQINLISPSSLGDLWERHVLDSAQLMRLAPNAKHWLDLGSGGGFPGAIVAILLMDYPDRVVDLVESNRKKAAFLMTALGQMGAPAVVHAKRIGSVTLMQSPEIVTARALAPLPVLLDLASPWLAEGARGLFHKGRDYRAEVQESRDGWAFDLVDHPSLVAPEGVILEISNLTPKRTNTEVR